MMTNASCTETTWRWKIEGGSVCTMKLAGRGVIDARLYVYYTLSRVNPAHELGPNQSDFLYRRAIWRLDNDDPL